VAQGLNLFFVGGSLPGQVLSAGGLVAVIVKLIGGGGLG